MLNNKIKYKKLAIKAKKLSHEMIFGSYKSAFKGNGLAFSELREYYWGDDIKNIDWNTSARHDKAYIKIFEAEREINLVLMIDVSASMLNSDFDFKKNVLSEISSLLAYAALYNGDKVSLILFDNKIIKYIKASKSRFSVLNILKSIDNINSNSKTNISSALKFTNNVLKKRSIIFIISDFIDNNFENDLSKLAFKHELNAIKINEINIDLLRNIKGIQYLDTETNFLSNENVKPENNMLKLFKRYKVACFEVDEKVNLVKSLSKFLKNRHSQ